VTVGFVPRRSRVQILAPPPYQTKGTWETVVPFLLSRVHSGDHVLVGPNRDQSPFPHELAPMEELVGVTDRVKIPTKAEFQVRLRITVPADLKNWSVCAGIGGQFPPEWLVNLERNEWSVSSGIGGQFAPEYARVPLVPPEDQGYILHVTKPPFLGGFVHLNID